MKLISVIFVHLKLWIAVARHKFKWLKILINQLIRKKVNPCAAEVFVSIFHSFEAGIANAIHIYK